MNDIIDAVTRLSIANSIPVFGTGESAPLESTSPGYRPSDTLPSVKSLLCMGVPVPQGVFKAGERSNEAYWRAANIYYRVIDAVLLQVARIIEEQGEIAVPVFG